ncbi:MAG: DUF1425 domain-containing protein [Planctomycetes bacterium]|nr:DUF1425 domain-containing protein [Planctomycetota bacterium]
MPSRTTLLAGCALLLVLTACGSTRAAAGAPPREPDGAESAAAAGVQMIDPRRGEERGVAILEVTLRNVTSAHASVRCAPEWYDARGALLEPASAWQTVELAAGAERRVRFAPTPSAARSWRLRFRP